MEANGAQHDPRQQALALSNPPFTPDATPSALSDEAAKKARELALRDTWGTPQALFDKLNAEVAAKKAQQQVRVSQGLNGGFTVDVCAEPWNAKVPCVLGPDGRPASQWWGPGSPTGVQDTLTQGNLAGHDWFGNWPFSKLGEWLRWTWRWYSKEARDAGMLAGFGVGVMPATRTEQEEWQTLVEPFRDKWNVAQQMGVYLETQFITTETAKNPYGRTKFVPPPGIKPSSPQFGTVILKWHPL